MTAASKPTVMVEFTDADGTDHVCIVRGRKAEALAKLIDVGAIGCTKAEFPAGTHVGSSFHELRRKGLVIETISEAHGGTCPGRHGRYVLRTRVRILAHEGV